MTKQQKILLLLVLTAISSSLVYYVNTSDTDTIKENEAVAGTSSENKTQELVNETAAQERKTFSQTQSYKTPAGNDEIIYVSVTLNKSSVIEDITFSHDIPVKPISEKMLTSFKANFSKELVVGKKIDEVSLSRVGGASLTTNAFNEALKGISSQIKG